MYQVYIYKHTNIVYTFRVIWESLWKLSKYNKWYIFSQQERGGELLPHLTGIFWVAREELWYWWELFFCGKVLCHTFHQLGHQVIPNKFIITCEIIYNILFLPLLNLFNLCRREKYKYKIKIDLYKQTPTFLLAEHISDARFLGNWLYITTR